MPFSSIPYPAVVHHMGALDGSPYPQNSLETIQASLEAGAAVIEVDVTALASRDYLLVHEPLLEAETDGHGPVGACTLEAARSLRIKHKGVVTPYAAPLLSDVVGRFLAAGGETRLQLDFKNTDPFPDDEPLARLARLIEPLGERVIVSSMADWQLRALHRLAPWLALGFDIMRYIDWRPPTARRDPLEYPRAMGRLGYRDDHLMAGLPFASAARYLEARCESFIGLVPGVQVFYLEHPLIAHSLDDGFNWAKALHQYGIRLDAWTMDVTRPAAVANVPRLHEAGVDLFTSNTPRAIARLLAGG